ncbi:receptor-like protein 9DC3 [Capsicum chacoense]
MGYMQFSFLLIFWLYLFSFSSSILHLCRKDERISLIKLKKSFTLNSSASANYCINAYPKTSSWNMSRDCCSWDGVICDEMTGHVIELHLSCNNLVGTIDSNSSLFQLCHLQSLDLSGNNFGRCPISPEFGRFSNLTYLDLSWSDFSGQIPSEISYLSKLQSLSIATHSDGTKLRLGPHNFKLLLQNLTYLRELDLSFVNIPSSIPLNFSSHLTILSLAYTGLHGIIPESIFNLPVLEILYLGGNQLQGHVPKSIRNLVNLTWLDLSFNNFSGPVDVSLFSDLEHLYYLSLSYNCISLTNEKEVKSTLPESLTNLLLAACDVKELEFLRSTEQLQELDLSNNKIQGRIPDWAWSNWNFRLSTLNLSHNMLTSVDTIPLQSGYIIDLRSNFLQGSLPIPPDTTKYFFISHNNLSKEIPPSICNLTSLVMLDLGRNKLKGAIPQCLGNINRLQILDMQRNSLTGTLPMTFRTGSSLRSLNLHGNKLEGKIPRSLANCTELEVLDLGDNHLIDTFPVWLGTLPKLQVLSLRSNGFHGSIQPSMIETIFPELRIIDLSYNAFSGNLPTSLFQHLKAMKTIDPSKAAPSDEEAGYYQDSVVVVTKGLELEVERILFLYTTIDLSNNRFEAHIPSVLGDLIALRVLNLSHNGLQGHIPSSLGNLSVVESLDFSFNLLSGEVPEQLESLTSLEFLNLSHNHLRGCIPQGRQFATFENNSYKGNDGLRGFPVSKGCESSGMPQTDNTTHVLDEESSSTFLGDFIQGILMGYGTGLIIGFSIAYFMLTSRNPNWLSRIYEELEHRVYMRRRKKQRDRQRHNRR